MAGITLAQAQTKLSESLTAYEKALNAEEYSIAGRSVKRADLDSLQKAITFWEKQVQRLSRSVKGLKVTGVTLANE